MTTTVKASERARRVCELDGFVDLGGGWLVRPGCRVVVKGDDLTIYAGTGWSARLSGDMPWSAVVAVLGLVPQPNGSAP